MIFFMFLVADSFVLHLKKIAGIWRDKTMEDKLKFIPIKIFKITPFVDLRFCRFETLKTTYQSRIRYCGYTILGTSIKTIRSDFIYGLTDT